MKALVFGPILFDLIESEAFLGGCPTNVAVHCARMGLDTTLISSVGDDAYGKTALACFRAWHVHTDYIATDPLHATGTTRVLLHDVTEPTYILAEDVAYDHIRLRPDQLARLRQTRYDVFYFGTVDQRGAESAQTLYTLLDQLEIRCRFCDLNLRENCYTRETVRISLEKADLLKVNEEELAYLRRTFCADAPSPEAAVRRLLTDFAIEMVLVTRGARGVSVFTGRQCVHGAGPNRCAHPGGGNRGRGGRGRRLLRRIPGAFSGRRRSGVCRPKGQPSGRLHCRPSVRHTGLYTGAPGGTAGVPKFPLNGSDALRHGQNVIESTQNSVG